MAVNATALAAVAIGWFFREWETLQPQAIAAALEVASLALVCWGGWMGGTLVYRNQIGVDHRYADAGKWREETIDGPPGELVVVPGAGELKPGQMILVHAAGKRIVVAKTANGYSAFDDRCTHRGASLADGLLACDIVTCPWHGSQFRVTDGAKLAGPAEHPVNSYRIEHSNGESPTTNPGIAQHYVSLSAIQYGGGDGSQRSAGTAEIMRRAFRLVDERPGTLHDAAVTAEGLAERPDRQQLRRPAATAKLIALLRAKAMVLLAALPTRPMWSGHIAGSGDINPVNQLVLVFADGRLPFPERTTSPSTGIVPRWGRRAECLPTCNFGRMGAQLRGSLFAVRGGFYPFDRFEIRRLVTC